MLAHCCWSAAEGFLAVSPAPDSRPEGLLAVSPVAVSDVHRASLGPGSRAESLLAASLAADLGALLHLLLLGHELTAFLSHSRPLYLTVSSGRSRLLYLLFSRTLLPRPGVGRPRNLRRAPCGRFALQTVCGLPLTICGLHLPFAAAELKKRP